MCGAAPLGPVCSAAVCLLITCTYVTANRTAPSAPLPPPPPPAPADYSNTHNTSELQRIDPKNSESKAPGDVADIEQDMELVDAVTVCNESFRIEMVFLISLNESGSFPDETDNTPKCFVLCVLQALRISSAADGALAPARAAAYFARTTPARDALLLATACTRRDEASQCDMAYNFLKCLFSADIERPHNNPYT